MLGVCSAAKGEAVAAMMEPMGREQLLELLLARRPDRVVDTAAFHPVDTETVGELRRSLVELASAAAPVVPSTSLRERLLATRPRPRRPVRPVVLVVDMINDHLRPGGPLEVPRARDIVPALRARLDELRGKSVPVVYVCDTHEASDPDLLDWPSHALVGTDGPEVWPELAPAPGDYVVPKPTYSAFAGSKLGALLEELHADEIILTGCATEIGLNATAIDALQRGYVVTIPPEAQAGMTQLGEMVTLLTLATMPPRDPIYLRAPAPAGG
jgi:nicotinamidase-related amidase